jgi:hypothetical protein
VNAVADPVAHDHVADRAAVSDLEHRFGAVLAVAGAVLEVAFVQRTLTVVLARHRSRARDVHGASGCRRPRRLLARRRHGNASASSDRAAAATARAARSARSASLSSTCRSGRAARSTTDVAAGRACNATRARATRSDAGRARDGTNSAERARGTRDRTARTAEPTGSEAARRTCDDSSATDTLPGAAARARASAERTRLRSSAHAGGRSCSSGSSAINGCVVATRGDPHHGHRYREECGCLLVHL